MRFLFSYVKIRMTYKRRKIKDGEKVMSKENAKKFLEEIGDDKVASL